VRATSLRARRAGPVTLRAKLTGRARRTLTVRRNLRLRLTATFTPAEADVQPVTVRRSVTLRR
jgi:hypothetical protein